MQYFVALLALFLEEAAKKAGQDVGKGIGEEILTSLFGKKSNNNIDIKALISQFASACSTVMRVQLDQYKLRELSAAIDAIQDEIGDIVDDPGTYAVKEKFYSLDSKIIDVIHQSNHLGLIGFIPCLLAIVQRIALRQVIYDNSTGILSSSLLPGNDPTSYFEMAENLKLNAINNIESRLRIVSSWGVVDYDNAKARLVATASLLLDGHNIFMSQASSKSDGPALEAKVKAEVRSHWEIQRKSMLNSFVNVQIISDNNQNIEPWDRVLDIVTQLHALSKKQAN